MSFLKERLLKRFIQQKTKQWRYTKISGRFNSQWEKMYHTKKKSVQKKNIDQTMIFPNLQKKTQT
jgi:hypothetical protein